ncbi:MAG: thrombospondin type-1 domain-containing protein, partial [Candidatus Gracilibacteria bacterium]
STGTGDILITQILGAQNNTIPCNPLAYSGYTISALAHNETKIFTKPLTVTNGSGTGSLQIQCINGILDTTHAIETPNVICNINYVNQANACILDVCGGTVPVNAQSTATSQTITQNWIRSTVPNICTFDCSTGYTWDNTNQLCSQNTWVSTTWGSCSQSCGGGTQSRTVTCQTSTGTVIADANCLGVKPVVSQTCNVQGCPVNGSCNNATNFACSAGTSVSNIAGSCGGSATWSCNGLNGGTNVSCSKANLPCPVNCSYTTYQGGSCSASCGGGNYSLYYTKTVVESNGGTCPITQGQYAGVGASCNTQACCSPTTVISTSACNAACGSVGTITTTYQCGNTSQTSCSGPANLGTCTKTVNSTYTGYSCSNCICGGSPVGNTLYTCSGEPTWHNICGVYDYLYGTACSYSAAGTLSCTNVCQ